MASLEKEFTRFDSLSGERGERNLTFASMTDSSKVASFSSFLI
jgi:hypothetical protein